MSIQKTSSNKQSKLNNGIINEIAEIIKKLPSKIRQNVIKELLKNIEQNRN